MLCIFLRFELGKSTRAIATRLIISHTSVKRIIRDYVAYGTIETPSRGQRDRPGIIAQEHMTFILDHLDLYDPELYLDEMSDLLHDVFQIRYRSDPVDDEVIDNYDNIFGSALAAQNGD